MLPQRSLEFCFVALYFYTLLWSVSGHDGEVRYLLVFVEEQRFVERHRKFTPHAHNLG